MYPPSRWTKVLPFLFTLLVLSAQLGRSFKLVDDAPTDDIEGEDEEKLDFRREAAQAGKEDNNSRIVPSNSNNTSSSSAPRPNPAKEEEFKNNETFREPQQPKSSSPADSSIDAVHWENHRTANNNVASEGGGDKGNEKSGVETNNKNAKEDMNSVDDLHLGSHDSHHPDPDSGPGQRPHNIEIFHPGLAEQLESESEKLTNEVVPSSLSEMELLEPLFIGGGGGGDDNNGDPEEQAYFPYQIAAKHNGIPRSITPRESARGGDQNQNPMENNHPVSSVPVSKEDPMPSDDVAILKTPLTSLSFPQPNVPQTNNEDEGWGSGVVESENNDDEEGQSQQPMTLFTIANTNVGIDYNRLPYREKYLWSRPNAPCYSFHMQIPDEKAEKAGIRLCIFRPNLEFEDETTLLMNADVSNKKQQQQKVYGYAINHPNSSVFGKMVGSDFFGEVVIMGSQEGQPPTIYVAEEIRILHRLVRNNRKTLAHLLMVMTNDKDKDNHHRHNTKRMAYNAVVTKGASLVNFMKYTNLEVDMSRNSFMMFTTSHISYISLGEPEMAVDDNGQVTLSSGNNKIFVDNVGSVRIFTPGKEYTFRPHGRTIVKAGMEVGTLQEHEGAVAVSAFTPSMTYDCLLPTPAFHSKRRGGYVCKVCLAADAEFSRSFIKKQQGQGSRSTQFFEINYLGNAIIDRVSWLLRSMDWNGDKVSDNIGLDYDLQLMGWTTPKFMDEDVVSDVDVQVLFQSLGKLDFSDCCLGVGYTMKKLPGNALGGGRSEGKSGTSKKSEVCARGNDERNSNNNNLIIISGNNDNNNNQGEEDSRGGGGGVLSEEQLIYLTAQQIASSFGANMDGAGGEDPCDQFVDEQRAIRHYLMWPDVLRNTTLREQSLSKCSINDIMGTLSTCKSACFDIDQHPFCGNGIVEDGEECDCGSEYSCSLQTCCFARNGKYPCRMTGIGCYPRET